MLSYIRSTAIFVSVPRAVTVLWRVGVKLCLKEFIFRWSSNKRPSCACNNQRTRMKRVIIILKVWRFGWMGRWARKSEKLPAKLIRWGLAGGILINNFTWDIARIFLICIFVMELSTVWFRLLPSRKVFKTNSYLYIDESVGVLISSVQTSA